jgi:hypothetical protein
MRYPAASWRSQESRSSSPLSFDDLAADREIAAVLRTVSLRTAGPNGLKTELHHQSRHDGDRQDHGEPKT